MASCGMGGSGSTAILSAGMRALPIGVPKLLVSTVAAGDVSPYVGSTDVTLMHSVVDVAGLNRVSLQIYTNAAAAMAGMVKAVRPEPQMKSRWLRLPCSATRRLASIGRDPSWTAPGGRYWSSTPREQAAEPCSASHPKDSWQACSI